jgi:hypothetical protein
MNFNKLPGTFYTNIYDSDYANRKKLKMLESHAGWLQNKYDKELNPNGIINFGTSVNTIVQKKTA